MIKNLKSKLTGALCAIPVALTSAAVMAQEAAVTPTSPVVDNLVDTTALRTTILNNIVAWLGIGLGVGLSLLIVYIGWRIFRRFTK